MAKHSFNVTDLLCLQSVGSLQSVVHLPNVSFHKLIKLTVLRISNCYKFTVVNDRLYIVLWMLSSQLP